MRDNIMGIICFLKVTDLQKSYIRIKKVRISSSNETKTILMEMV